MKNKILKTSMILTVFLLLTSCFKLKDNGLTCSSLWVLELADELSNYYEAAIAYGSDQSVENCEAYKDATQAYIDAMEPYGDCAALTGTSRDEWQASLDEAREEIENLDCTANN